MTRRLAPVPVNPSRVVLYARVSALMGRGGDDFHSPSVQVSAMRRLAAGMREVAVIEDIDRTGRNFNREGITKVRGMAERGEIDALAVYDVSRLGRNVRESLTFLAELAGRGVTILSACEQVDTSTPAGRLMLTNMLAIAEYRSDEIGRSWSASINRAAELGKHHGHPFGYTRYEGRLTPDPVLGPVFAKVWLDYAAGVPISQIVSDVSRATGRPQRANNLKKIFTREVYRGHTVAGGQIVARDAHPALVDDETWERVQRRLARDRKEPGRALEVTWSLVGISYCTCGKRLQRNPKIRNGVREQRLICGGGPSRNIKGGCDGCGCPRLDAVEAEVLRQLEEYLRELKTRYEVRAEQIVRRHRAIADERALKRAVVAAQEGVVRLAKMNAMGQLDDEEFAAAAGQLRAERDGIHARLAELGDTGDGVDPEKFATAAQALLRMWPEMNAQRRNRALRAIVDRVVVRKATRWREPVEDLVTVTWR